MHPHFPRDVSQYDMAIIQLDSKHGVRKRFRDRTLDFDNVFFCHVLLYSFLMIKSKSSPIDSKCGACRLVGRQSYARSEQISSHLP